MIGAESAIPGKTVFLLDLFFTRTGHKEIQGFGTIPQAIGMIGLLDERGLALLLYWKKVCQGRSALLALFLDWRRLCHSLSDKVVSWTWHDLFLLQITSQNKKLQVGQCRIKGDYRSGKVGEGKER